MDPLILVHTMSLLLLLAFSRCLRAGCFVPDVPSAAMLQHLVAPQGPHDADCKIRDICAGAAFRASICPAGGLLGLTDSLAAAAAEQLVAERALGERVSIDAASCVRPPERAFAVWDTIEQATTAMRLFRDAGSTACAACAAADSAVAWHAATGLGGFRYHPSWEGAVAPCDRAPRACGSSASSALCELESVDTVAARAPGAVAESAAGELADAWRDQASSRASGEGAAAERAATASTAASPASPGYRLLGAAAESAAYATTEGAASSSAVASCAGALSWEGGVSPCVAKLWATCFRRLASLGAMDSVAWLQLDGKAVIGVLVTLAALVLLGQLTDAHETADPRLVASLASWEAEHPHLDDMRVFGRPLGDGKSGAPDGASSWPTRNVLLGSRGHGSTTWREAAAVAEARAAAAESARATDRAAYICSLAAAVSAARAAAALAETCSAAWYDRYQGELTRREAAECATRAAAAQTAALRRRVYDADAERAVAARTTARLREQVLAAERATAAERVIAARAAADAERAAAAERTAAEHAAVAAECAADETSAAIIARCLVTVAVERAIAADRVADALRAAAEASAAASAADSAGAAADAADAPAWLLEAEQLLDPSHPPCAALVAFSASREHPSRARREGEGGDDSNPVAGRERSPSVVAGGERDPGLEAGVEGHPSLRAGEARDSYRVAGGERGSSTVAGSEGGLGIGAGRERREPHLPLITLPFAVHESDVTLAEHAATDARATASDVILTERATTDARATAFDAIVNGCAACDASAIAVERATMSVSAAMTECATIDVSAGDDCMLPMRSAPPSLLSAVAAEQAALQPPCMLLMPFAAGAEHDPTELMGGLEGAGRGVPTLSSAVAGRSLARAACAVTSRHRGCRGGRRGQRARRALQCRGTSALPQPTAIVEIDAVVAGASVPLPLCTPLPPIEGPSVLGSAAVMVSTVCTAPVVRAFAARDCAAIVASADDCAATVASAGVCAADDASAVVVPERAAVDVSAAAHFPLRALVFAPLMMRARRL